MKKIDFLIIGTQKSGTTALNKYLTQHPKIQMATTKEVHFFDNESNFENKNVDYNQYHQFFSLSNADKIYGEATPIYSYWDNSISRIWEYNKNIKLILLLRNPIERAYSHWNMERSRNAEKFSFWDAINLEKERIKENLPFKHRVYSYIDRGFYSEQIRNIYRFFPKNQVLILKHESLQYDYKSTLTTITNFLDVNSFDFKELKNIHSREYQASLSHREHTFLRNIFIKEIEVLEKELKWDCSIWKEKKKKKKILFYRDFKAYTGGHQKYFDYYKHFKEHSSFDVEIFFTPNSIWSSQNPWIGEVENIVKNFNLENYDVLFIAGMDWNILEEGIENKVPVINFIQGMRHTNSEHILNTFLKRKASRITVSPMITQCLEKEKNYNGTLYTIDNGIKLKVIEEKKVLDIYILGLKNPKLAKLLEDRLSNLGFKVLMTSTGIPREEVHQNMAMANISLLLPNYTEGEGFYLPALESMQYSDITIVPNCIGNESFCSDGINCLMPKYELESMVNACINAKKMLKNGKFKDIKVEALRTVNKHSLEKEKESLYTILKECLDV